MSKLWLALLPLVLWAHGTVARGRKPLAERSNSDRDRTSMGQRELAEQVTLRFDGNGRLGLGFAKGLTPLTIRHITPDTWGSLQTELHSGMEIVSIGAQMLVGLSYSDAIDLLRSAIDVSSESAQLELTFGLSNRAESVSHGRRLKGSNDEQSSRRLIAGCTSVRERDLQSADRHLSAFLTAKGHGISGYESANHPDALRQALQSSAGDLTQLAVALRLAVRIDLDVETATIASSETGTAWEDNQQALQQSAVDMYNLVAEAAAATPRPQATWSQHIELAALIRSSAYSWSMQHLGMAIRAQRRAVELINSSSDLNMLLSTTEQAETRTQLGILLITRGSVVNSKADHAEAARELIRARQLSPVDPYHRAYLGFAYGQPLLADYGLCSEHLLAGLDADWSVRGQHAVANLMIGTLDNCLTRIGQPESAAAVREFAVGSGIWAHKDRQNNGILVAYPGMENAQPWWDSASSVSKQLGRLVKDLVANLNTLQVEATTLLTSRGCGTSGSMGSVEGCFKHNQEGVHDGDWVEASLVPIGGGPLDPTMCGNDHEDGPEPLLPKLCDLLRTHHSLTSVAGGNADVTDGVDIQLARLSALRGSTHIWPHSGPTNARLRLHFPLLVPAGRYELTVADQPRSWQAGVPLIFDDSFRHEVVAEPAMTASEDSAAVRLVLILDVWHPAVPLEEREMLGKQLVEWSERRSSYDL